MAYNKGSGNNPKGGGGMEIISPMLDVMFKRMFSMKNGEPYLCDFLNTFCDFNGKDVTTARLVDKEIKRYRDDKGSVFDLRVEAGGAEIDMEVQLMKLEGDRERFTLYLSKMYSDQLKEGMDYKDAHNCKSLLILDYALEEHKDSSDFFHSYKLRDERGSAFADTLEMCVVEIPLIRDIKITPELDNRLMWAKLFAAESEEELDMISDKTSNPQIRSATLVVKRLSERQSVRLEAEKRMKSINDERARLLRASNDGRAEGIAEGRAEGRAERDKEIAAAMRKSGMTEEQISKILNNEPKAQEAPKKSPPKRGKR